MMIWQKLLERHELCFVFFCAGCTHCTHISISFTIWQALDNVSNFVVASPLCGRNAPLKKSMPFEANIGLNIIMKFFGLQAACSEAPLTHMALSDISILISKFPSRDRVLVTGIYLCSKVGYKWRPTHPRHNCRASFLSNSEVHIKDVRRTVDIYFSSANKMSSPNEPQKH